MSTTPSPVATHIGLWKRFTHEVDVVFNFVSGHAAQVEKVVSEGATIAEAASPMFAPEIALFNSALQNLFGHVAATVTSADTAVNAGGLSVTLDEDLVSQVKAAAEAIKSLKLSGVAVPPAFSAGVQSTPAPTN